MAAHNKNKHSFLILTVGLVIAVAGFLWLPGNQVIAETTGTDTPANTNTAPVADTNVNAEQNQNITEINEAIDEKRKALDDLKKKADIYQQNIKTKQQETVTLENQLSIIDLQVQQTENDIESITGEMDAVKLEIDGLNVQIDEQTAELEYQKTVLAEYLRLIHEYDQRTYLEILMVNDSFSDFFDQLQYTENLQSNVEGALKTVKAAKDELESERTLKEDKHTELKTLSEKLASSIVDLGNQKDYKVELLGNTKESEEKFMALLAAAQKEQQAAEAEVSTLESQAREKLEGEGIDLHIEATLTWPVSPTRGISAYFHDPTYIFRKYFEHPAIDIPASQGTPIRAAANGYVVRAKNSGMGYSYVMLVHNDDISSVYGHMSRIDVAEDTYVVRGQLIGLIGGMPGTPGAGPFTTGPHLHFEVRSNGIPVNPLDYLPPL